MAEGVLYNITEKILESIGEKVVKEVASWWGARDDLKKLGKTLELIKARVRDAENRREADGSESIKAWLERLKWVLYQADDLFDEVITIDFVRKRHIEGNKLVNKVRSMFTSSGSLRFNWKIGHEIKSIRQELDALNSDMAALNLRETHYPPTTRLMNERKTISFIQSNQVIGRKNELDEIIGILFESKYNENKIISVVPIVGMGKTTLAQLVFNDERVQKKFDMIKWACVPEVNNEEVVLGKIYEAFSGRSYKDISLDRLQTEIRELISSKKYLLVLDDVWDDSHHRWLKLKCLLECGMQGSKVIVTTRSNEIAERVMTISEPYKLGLLTVDDSWKLFSMLAFKAGQEVMNPKLVEIGREIVEHCANLPLALRMVGSLLNSKREDEWERLRNSQVFRAKLTESDNVMPVLKLSYDYLDSPLKRCFAYCSLFPKDYLFSKVELIRLWMAQGFFKPSKEEGEWCFMELVRRNFFHEVVEQVENGDIQCKMHDLLNDLAQEVSGDENKLVDKSRMQFNDGTFHINVITDAILWEDSQHLLGASKMRSLLLHQVSYHTLQDVKTLPGVMYIPNYFRSLRSLKLQKCGIETLPKSIWRLIHLRNLDLSENRISILSEDIGRLQNLQTLNLTKCCFLRELPRVLTKMPNLLHLLTNGCIKLEEMPPGFGEMKSLQELDEFIVGMNNGLDALNGLDLWGKMEIKFRRWRENAELESQQSNLKKKQYLTSLKLWFDFREDEPSCGDEALLLKSLGLPPNLRYLCINEYKGEKLPCGIVNELYKLVKVYIYGCRRCKVLPSFGHLPNLQDLSLYCLDALEYIEDEWNRSIGEKLFPSLKSLTLFHVKELKGWSRVDQKQHELCFPCLSHLLIHNCPKMMSMPQVPSLVSLNVRDIHEKLLVEFIRAFNKSPAIPIDELHIFRIHELVSLSIDFDVTNLDIWECKELKSLNFRYPNSPRSLTILGSDSCKISSGGLGNLSAVAKLNINEREDLELWDTNTNTNTNTNTMDDDDNEIRNNMMGWQWRSFKSLHSLKVYNIRNIITLPPGIFYIKTIRRLMIARMPDLRVLCEDMDIGNLSLLQELVIYDCPKLEALPKSIQSLTSLHTLEISRCTLLTIRCRQSDGEDWPLVRRIPNFQCTDECC